MGDSNDEEIRPWTCAERNALLSNAGLDEPATVEEAASMNDTPAVVVARVSSVIEAQFIVGMLDAHGIAAAVSADDAGGFDPQLQVTQGVRVLVGAEDDAKARQLIAEANT